MLLVLEAIARDDSLEDVLAAICQASDAREDAAPDQRTSILLYDERRGVLHGGVAPRLPKTYVSAVEGLKVGPDVGSCGTAVSRREPVVVEDIQTDPLWQNFRELAANHDLRACWSTPVIGSTGAILASFAVYRSIPARPTDRQMEDYRRASHLVSIAIERHQAKQRLRDSEERLAFALDGSNDGLWDWNIQTGETYFSPRWETMLGFEPGEVTPNVSSWAELTHPDDMPHVMEVLQAHLRGELPIYQTEHRVRRKDGGWAWILDRGKVVARAADGTPLRAVGTHSDITTRKEMEGALREAQKKAEAASRAKTEFLACMSHELRTPLNAVIGFSELLAAGVAGTLTTRQASYIGDIHSSGQLLLDIVSDLLDYARIEAGKLEVRLEPTSVRVVAGSAMMLLRRRAQLGGIRVRAHIPRDLPCVHADPSRMQQVLINLLSNAIKFTPEGGRVTLMARDAGGQVEIAVTDTGIGMTPAEIELAMQPFTQVDQRYSRRYEGTGLGLSIAKSLVDLHQGTLAVQSEKGQGTTVSVILPQCEGPCGRSPQTSRSRCTAPVTGSKVAEPVDTLVFI